MPLASAPVAILDEAMSSLSTNSSCLMAVPLALGVCGLASHSSSLRFVLMTCTQRVAWRCGRLRQQPRPLVPLYAAVGGGGLFEWRPLRLGLWLPCCCISPASRRV